jgi:hypothetical protein
MELARQPAAAATSPTASTSSPSLAKTQELPSLTEEEQPTYEKSIADLNEFLLSFKIVSILNSKLPLPPFAVFMIFLLITGLIFGYFFGIIRFIQLLGFICPAYVTTRALDGDSEVDILRWIKYWVIFSIGLVAEPICDATLYWVPYYEVIKFAGWVWLCLPFTHATSFLYDLVIARFFIAHKEHIDQGIHAVRYKSLQATRELRTMSTQLIRQASASIVMATFNGLSQSGSSQTGSQESIDTQNKGYVMADDVDDEDSITPTSISKRSTANKERDS